MGQPSSPRTPKKGQSVRMQLVAVVDRVPETRGFGVCYRKGGQFVRLRAQPAGGATVIFERH